MTDLIAGAVITLAVVALVILLTVAVGYHDTTYSRNDPRLAYECPVCGHEDILECGHHD
jgi:hypothetical protein